MARARARSFFDDRRRAQSIHQVQQATENPAGPYCFVSTAFVPSSRTEKAQERYRAAHLNPPGLYRQCLGWLLGTTRQPSWRSADERVLVGCNPSWLRRLRAIFTDRS